MKKIINEAKNSKLDLKSFLIGEAIQSEHEQQLDQLKQTITEIKEIAEKQCNVCEALTPIDEYKDCKKCWQGVILQKISECEVKNE